MIRDSFSLLFSAETFDTTVALVVITGFFVFMVTRAIVWVFKAWFPQVNGRLDLSVAAALSLIFTLYLYGTNERSGVMMAIVYWALILTVAMGIEHHVNVFGREFGRNKQ